MGLKTYSMVEWGCPKCGNTSKRIVKFIPQEQEDGEVYPEHLRVSCGTCGYQSNYACMDNDEQERVCFCGSDNMTDDPDEDRCVECIQSAAEALGDLEQDR